MTASADGWESPGLVDSCCWSFARLGDVQNIGVFDDDGKWIDDDARNFKWVARSGTVTFAPPSFPEDMSISAQTMG